MSHSRTMVQIANERGARSEQRVAEALRAIELTNKPPWFLDWRHSTLEEDSLGVDYVIDSDVGKLYLQVKSSRAGVHSFGSRRRRKLIGCVRVRPDADVAPAVLSTLGQVRALVVRRRDR